MAEPSIVTNALRLADDGWKVFPCDNQKAPVCKSGFKAASDDPIEIVRLFSVPNAGLIGRPTGAESGLVVVDIDIKGGKDGRQWPRYGDLPATRRVQTQSGGYHIYFKHPGGRLLNSAGTLFPGVDIRGDGGYVITPPSQGYHVVVDVEPAAMPQWLVELTTPGQSGAPSTPTGVDADGLLRRLARGDGSWHNDVLRLTAYWVTKGLNDEEILERAPDLTWPDYTVEQTISDMRTMIDGARAKYDSTYRKATPIPFALEGPQPLLPETIPGAGYPVEALGPLRGAVEAVQGRTLAPMAIPAQSALAVASLAVQGHADVETLGGHRPLSLYCLTIAKSGERKSSCDAPLMAELRNFEKAQAEELRGDVTAWKNKSSLWKVEHDRILGDAKKARGEKAVAAEADLRVLGDEPAAPPLPDRTVTEPTYEGLTRLFSLGQPSLGIFSDEGGQFLGGFAMNSDNRQKTLTALNDLWQGNPIKRTRQGENFATLYGRRLASHLMVQPGVARRFMADPMAADTGFLPRFLICEPPSAIGTRLHSFIKEGAFELDIFSDRMKDILKTALPMDPETRELNPRTLPLAAEAKVLLVTFADSIERKQAPGREMSHIAGYASKAAEQACRIAGVLTLWRDLNAPHVTPEAIRHGIDLARFYLGEVQRIADVATISAEIDKAEALRKWLLDNWKEAEISVRDVVQNGPGGLRESPKARAALAILEMHGWLLPLAKGTIVRGTARKESWRIVRGDDAAN
jgi:hypothetical protein